MILLKQEKIIALKARKVGGTSFEIALSKYANSDSIITPIADDDEKLRKELGFHGPQNYTYTKEEFNEIPLRFKLSMLFNKKKRFKFYNHMPASLLKERLNEKVWSDYLKIAIIRNPFDYMVSSYFWESKTKKKKIDLTFEDYVLKKKDKVKANQRIYKIENKNIIDYMIRYDKLDQDIRILENKYKSLNGLANTFLNLSTKAHYRPKKATAQEMFKNAPEALNFVLEQCKEDIEKYNFDIPKSN